jgi:hypothetical protein
MNGYGVHGESITDGDSSGGIAVTLYTHGGVTERTLAADEVLYVSDVRIQCENGGDISLVADSKAAGRYVVHGSVDAKGGIVLHFQTPYACPVGKGLKFYGAAANLNVCLIEGFIMEA